MDIFSGISRTIDRIAHFDKPNYTNGREAVRQVVESSDSGLNQHFVISRFIEQTAEKHNEHPEDISIRLSYDHENKPYEIIITDSVDNQIEVIILNDL